MHVPQSLQPVVAPRSGGFKTFGDTGKKLSGRVPIVILAMFLTLLATASGRVVKFVLFLTIGEILRIQHGISPYIRLLFY
jgi:hypothetical protein